MQKRTKIFASTIVVVLVLGIFFLMVFPPEVSNQQFLEKPIILYYDYENLPFGPSQFPQIVNATLQHHFNTLMLLVFIDHKPIFNKSTIEYFFSYSESRNLKFVPSYYIESLSDNINFTGLGWINLDMERISPNDQRFFYARIASQGIAIISVTFPFGQPVEFSPTIDIVETYSGSQWFWFMQAAYFHNDHICSIGIWQLQNQQEYNSQKDYCLKYSDGVMVFDYYNLLRTGFD
jgi:hypothetical protein